MRRTLHPGLDRVKVKARSKPGQSVASLRGIALHDLYHAGQIRMLQRMIEQTPL